MEQTPLQRAVSAEPFSGNQSKFADALGTSQQNISNWLRKGAQIPAHLVLRAEQITGIPRHLWRPDVFPLPSPSEAA